MKRDKALIEIDGQPMIQHIYNQLIRYFQEVLISSNDPDKYGFLPARIIKDRITGQGPLQGLYAALSASESDLNFVTACDIPVINMDLVQKLVLSATGFDCVIPVAEPDRLEPLFAVYRKSVTVCIEEALTAGSRKISDIFTRCRVNFVDLEAGEKLWNINTPEDFAQFRSTR